MAIVDNVEQEPWETKCPCCNAELSIKWSMGYYEDHASAFFDDIACKTSIAPSYPRFVQALNPKTKKYVKIDRKEGKIISHKRDSEPYKNIMIIRKQGV